MAFVFARAVGAQAVPFAAINPLDPTWSYGDLLGHLLPGSADGASIQIFENRAAAMQSNSGIAVQLQQLISPTAALFPFVVFRLAQPVKGPPANAFDVLLNI